MPGKAGKPLQIVTSGLEELHHLYTHVDPGLLPKTRDELSLAYEIAKKVPEKPLRAKRLVTDAYYQDQKKPKRTKQAWKVLERYIANAETSIESGRTLGAFAVEIQGRLGRGVDAPSEDGTSPNTVSDDIARDVQASLGISIPLPVIARTSPDTALIDVDMFVPESYRTYIARWLRHKDLNAMLSNGPEVEPEPEHNPYWKDYEKTSLGIDSIKEVMRTVTIGEVDRSIGGYMAQEDANLLFWARCIDQVSEIQVGALRNVAATAGRWVTENEIVFPRSFTDEDF